MAINYWIAINGFTDSYFAADACFEIKMKACTGIQVRVVMWTLMTLNLKGMLNRRRCLDRWLAVGLGRIFGVWIFNSLVFGCFEVWEPAQACWLTVIGFGFIPPASTFVTILVFSNYWLWLIIIRMERLGF